ncbi:Hpt domain-containing protein [Thiocystis violacea]|uniref:Hpt domain-containing protein n=1 Tax=Thiocystis violacea TaxID=13725 RepID=UPI0019081CCB|nr:Hpt domain-containing protein [Thiocystis violacea]
MSRNSPSESLTPGDTARYRELRATFLAELPGQLEAMGRALERQEYGDLATIAHKLKGVAGSFGLPEATRVAGVIETRARQDHDEGIAERLRELERICQVDGG